MDLNPKVPPALSNLVMECVSTKPSKRPADMDQVLTRLELAKHILTKQANPGNGTLGTDADLDADES